MCNVTFLISELFCVWLKVIIRKWFAALEAESWQILGMHDECSLGCALHTPGLTAVQKSNTSGNFGITWIHSNGTKREVAFGRSGRTAFYVKFSRQSLIFPLPFSFFTEYSRVYWRTKKSKEVVNRAALSDTMLQRHHCTLRPIISNVI